MKKTIKFTAAVAMIGLMHLLQPVVAAMTKKLRQPKTL